MVELPKGFFWYGVLGGRVIGSEYPGLYGRGREVVQGMVEGQGIRAMVTLTEEAEEWQVAGLVRHHVPMVGVPELEAIERAVELVRGHVGRGERVWVHCRRGLDRTGTVLACVLVATGRGPEEAIEEIAGHFPPLWRYARKSGWWDKYGERIKEYAGRGARNGEQ